MRMQPIRIYRPREIKFDKLESTFFNQKSFQKNSHWISSKYLSQIKSYLLNQDIYKLVVEFMEEKNKNVEQQLAQDIEIKEARLDEVFETIKKTKKGYFVVSKINNKKVMEYWIDYYKDLTALVVNTHICLATEKTKEIMDLLETKQFDLLRNREREILNFISINCLIDVLTAEEFIAFVLYKNLKCDCAVKIIRQKRYLIEW